MTESDEFANENAISKAAAEANAAPAKGMSGHDTDLSATTSPGEGGAGSNDSQSLAKSQPVQDRGDGTQKRLFGLSPRAENALWGLITLTSVGTVVWLAVLSPTVSVPLLSAFIIAYLLDPIVDRFEARGISRSPAIAVILGGFLLASVALISLLTPQLIREFSQVPSSLQVALSRLLPWIEGTFQIQLPANLQQFFVLVEAQIASIDVKSLANPAATLLRGVYGGTLGLVSGFATLVMVPIFAFYLLRDFDDVIARIQGLIPRRYRGSILARIDEIDVAMNSFIRGQIIVAAILSTLYFMGFWWIGMPLAVVVSLVAGIGNMVPYVGTVLGAVLAISLSLLSADAGSMLLHAAVVFLCVQVLEGWVITPKVVGESVGLSSFAVIVSVLFFGELLGFVGVLIAVPLAAILKILLRVFLEQYRQSSFFEN